jgi:hypothetical protein
MSFQNSNRFIAGRAAGMLAVTLLATTIAVAGERGESSHRSPVTASSAPTAAGRPVVVELFTSLACSDCPPADALLARVRAQDSDVLALALHVTYWNDASWTDPYSLPGADEMQKEYAARQNTSTVYTPEVVVDGQRSFVGSDSRTMAVAIGQAKAKIAAGGTVPEAIRSSPQGLSVFIGSGSGAGTVWLFGFDATRTTAVFGGENAGATIREVNVVRSITRLGDWRGRRIELNTRAPAGTRFAVILQKADGVILAAALS